MKKLFSILLFIFFCSACQPMHYESLTLDANASEVPADFSANEPGETSGTDDANPRSTVTLTSLTPSRESLLIKPGQAAEISLTATLSNGSIYPKLTNSLETPYGLQLPVVWYSNDTSVATIDVQGRIETLSEGETVIKANLGNLATLITVMVAESDPVYALTDFSFKKTFSQTSLKTPLSLFVSATFDDLGAYSTLTAASLREYADCDPVFSSSDDSIATIDANAVVIPLQNGSVELTGTCGELVTTMPLTITAFSSDALDETPLPDTDEPQDDNETTPPEDQTESTSPEDGNRFLGDDDDFTLSLGENGGFGEVNFPEIILHEPDSSRTDVLSMGIGGELTIELKGFIIVDGEGPDFTVFENAFSGWVEPAYVAVSENGIDYFTFACDPTGADPTYEGCAGITPVNYGTDYEDPEISGGDIFDLAEIGLSTARFIRITDAAVCDNPMLCVANTAGFDLDGMIILNGTNITD